MKAELFSTFLESGEEFHGEGKLLDRSCHREYNPLPQVWEGSMPEEGSHSTKADGLRRRRDD